MCSSGKENREMFTDRKESIDGEGGGVEEPILSCIELPGNRI